MSSSKVVVSRSHISSGVLIITINRAKVVNCVDGETADALEKAFIAFEEDPEVRRAVCLLIRFAADNVIRLGSLSCEEKAGTSAAAPVSPLSSLPLRPC